jgi:phage gpG-like protein
MISPSYSLRIDPATLSRARGAVTAAGSLRASEAVRKAIDLGMLELVQVAMKDRFTGKGPFPVSQKKLGVVSGRLRRDLHTEAARPIATGFSARIGSNVEYFAAHELGFSGTVQVKAHQRSRYTTRRGYSVLEQSVRAHSKHMTVPKREPLMTAIRAHSMRIISAAIDRAIAPILKPA